MKTLRRSRLPATATPWEKLCGDGFATGERCFVLLVDAGGRLIAATPQWHARLARWWRWDEGATWQEATLAKGSETAWEQWVRLVRAALASDTALQTTLRLQRGRRASLRLECLGQPVTDAAGHAVGAIIVGRFHASRERAAATPLALDAPRASDDVATLWIRAKRRRSEAGYFVESVSTGAGNVLGDEPELQVGMDFPEGLPVGLRGAAAEVFERTLDTREPSLRRVETGGETDARQSWELTLLPAPGERWCLIVQRRTAQASAKALLVACAGQIVTLERELRRAQRLATQGMLAAAIGHEIHNCLALALANASLFREQYGAQREAVRAIEPVIFAVETAGKICLRFRQLGGRSNAAPGLIDLGLTLQRSFEMLVRIVARKIVYTPPDGELLVRADPIHIDQIVVNLVLNARDATRENSGRIELKAGRTDDGAGRDLHWFEVADDGAGIPAAVQKKLFTAYFTTKANRRGTGLGLATVLRLTKSMGGDVKLTSGVGRGTRVRVTLPAADAAKAA